MAGQLNRRTTMELQKWESVGMKITTAPHWLHEGRTVYTVRCNGLCFSTARKDTLAEYCDSLHDAITNGRAYALKIHEARLLNTDAARRFACGETFNDTKCFEYGSRAGELDGWRVEGDSLFTFLPSHRVSGRPYGTQKVLVATRSLKFA
jgi:hypothetical protein